MEKKIIVSGSLNPEKEVQDRVIVLSGGGYMSRLTGNRLQRPSQGGKNMQKENKMIVAGVIDADGFIKDNKVYFKRGVRSHIKGVK